MARLTVASFANDVVVGALVVERDHTQSPGPDRNLVEGVGAIHLIDKIEPYSLDSFKLDQLPRPLGPERGEDRPLPQVEEDERGDDHAYRDDSGSTSPSGKALPATVRPWPVHARKTTARGELGQGQVAGHEPTSRTRPARSLADRARGFRAISSSPGTTGFFVKTSTRPTRASRLRKCFTIRSSSE